MHPTLNYRQSRRSACDRCRGFKLRCERDQVHGRSCERCLKAQVVCTTNIGHPTSSFFSKSPARGLPNAYDERLLHGDRFPMPILHKSTNAKVRKPVLPSNINRRCDIQDVGYWRGPEMFPYGRDLMIPEDMRSQVPSQPASLLPYEHWSDPSPWAGGPYCIPPSLESNFFDSDYRFEDLSSGPESLHLVDSISLRNGTHLETSVPPSLESLSLPDIGSAAVVDEPWAPWVPDMIHSNNGLSTLPAIKVAGDLERKSLRKQLSKMNLGLVEDLDVLESESIISSSSSLLKEDINSAVGKLDLPIFRMLNFSAQFLEILQAGAIAFGNLGHLAGLGTDHKECDSQENHQPLMVATIESNLEDGETTASSTDSGYLTMTTSPSNNTKALLFSRYDMPTSLGILVTYCHLVRVYRSVFVQLYQLFLIMPPADASPFLLLPTLQFRQFHMDGSLAMQVQVLIELCSNLLSEIERNLGMPYGSAQELDGEITQAEAVLGNGPLALISKQIISQERMECGVSLKETFECLRQLVKASDSS